MHCSIVRVSAVGFRALQPLCCIVRMVVRLYSSSTCRGSALLIGVGGSGKQSLARFAALVADCDVFTVNVRRGYGIASFREEVKQLYKVGRGGSACLTRSTTAA